MSDISHLSFVSSADSASAAMAREASLLSLPVELLVETLVHTDAPTILRASQVCKSLATVCNESTELQYMIELFAAGLSSNPECTSWSVRARLDSLRARKDAWVKPDWEEYSTLDIAEFVFENSTRRSKPYTLVSGGILCVWQGHRIYFKELASKFRCTAAREWVIEDVQFEVITVHVVPEHDLLIAAALTSSPGQTLMHILDMYTGLQHPQATEECLEEMIEGEDEDSRIIPNIESRGSYLCTSYGHRPEEVVVWDWRRGVAVFTVTEDTIGSALFLDPTRLVYTTTMDVKDGIDTEYASTPRSRVFLHVVDLVKYEVSSVMGDFETAYEWVFVYPILHNVHQGDMVFDMSCGHVDPTGPCQPFLAEEPPLLVTSIEITATRPGRPNLTYVHAIPIQPLLKRIEDSDPGTQAFPWSQWCNDTLMFPYNHEEVLHDSFFYSVHGWTLIFPALDNEVEWTIYDFNPRQAKRAVTSQESLGHQGSAHVGPQHFGGPNDPHDPRILDVGRAKSRVTTGIPYRKFERVGVPETDDARDVRLTNGGVIFHLGTGIFSPDDKYTFQTLACPSSRTTEMQDT